jgi:hypothetical protein
MATFPPDRIAALEAAYGAPSQAGFGSAVFTAHLEPGDDLEDRAKGWYRHFVGDRWDAMGEQAWMGPWKVVHERPVGSTPDIVAELGAIEDRAARSSADMILTVVESPEAARAALAGVYDDQSMTYVGAYALGDGGAMSGILVAGRAASAGTAIFLVFLLD